MRDLGPWPSDPLVAVAVSGGADSMALALLTRNWARRPPLGLVVDHRLRPGSTGEAEATGATLAGLGIEPRILAVDGLQSGPRLQERARRARHAILARACLSAGVLDLCLGHHRADQEETLRMRARAGSGPDGLAGIARLSERNRLRLLRPLLAIAPDRLRATLREAGVAWIEDPANCDPSFERTRLRATPGPVPPIAPADRERDADWLARHVTIHEAGFAILPAAPMPMSALSRLVQTISGREHPPRRAATERLADHPRPATLHGVRLIDAGRFGDGLIACREPSAVAAPVPATDDAIWDNRFRLRSARMPVSWTFGAVDPRCRADRFLPAAITATLPAVYDAGGAMRSAPHLGITDPEHEIDVIFAPALPIAPSFFMSG